MTALREYSDILKYRIFIEPSEHILRLDVIERAELSASLEAVINQICKHDYKRNAGNDNVRIFVYGLMLFAISFWAINQVINIVRGIKQRT